VLATLFTAIQIPDIELVLGITGSTIGTVICILFPVSMFIKLVNVNTTEKLVAQAIFIIGVIVLVLGTYVTLYEADSKHVESPVPKLDPGFVAPQPVAINKLDVINPQIALPKLSDVKNNLDSTTKAPDNVVKGEVNLLKEKPKEIVEVRQEPIQPLPPKEDVDKNEDSVPNLVTEKSIQSSSNVTVEQMEEESIKQKEKVLEIKEKQANKLIKQLKEQKQEHAQIIKQQKEVLEQLKDHVDAEKAQDSNVDGGQQVNLGPNAVQSNQEQVIRQDVFPAQQQVPVQQIIHNDAQGPIKTNQIITNANNGIKQNMENQNNNMQPHQIFPQQPIQNNPQQNAIQQQPIAQNQQMFQPSPNQHQPVVQNQPVLQQVPNVQQQPILQNRPVLQQASNGQQQVNVKNYQAVQNDANIQQQQQIFQNRPSNNIQASQFQMSNQNPAPQQPIIQGDAYQNKAQLQGKINQKRQILQPKLNGENPIPQQQINNQVLGNQLSQAQNQLEQQISQGQFQQQNIQGQNIQVPLQKQQQPVPINNQVPQFLNQNAVGIPALQQQWVEGQNQLSNQTQLNMQQNIENNLGMQQANINSDNFAQQNQYQQQKDISNLNIKPRSKDGGNEGYISSNLKPVIENRGKVDVKRETKKIQRNFEGKIKLPGRDLKEVNANFLGNNYAEESEISKVVKRDTVPEQLLDVQDTRMAQSLKIENLNKLAIVGASMGIVKTRHLLSEDSKKRYS
jgi:sodium-coupled neutral amino acid transporter 10